MHFKQKLWHFLGWLLVAALLPACAATKIQSISMDETYTGGPIKKILIVGMSTELKSRLKFEKTFAEQFTKQGVNAVASHKVIILAKDLTKERILKEAAALDADAILVTSVIGIKDEYLTYDPANVQRATRSKLSWDWVNTYASEPVTYTKTESVRLSTTIFERKSEELVWSAITETVRMESAEEVIDSLCGAVLKNIREHGLIK